MRIKVTKRQFMLLYNNFYILTNNQLKMKMDGKTFSLLFGNRNEKQY